jgi:acyl carrier protein
MPFPDAFAKKSDEQIRAELAGFPPDAVEAALRFRSEGTFDAFAGMLPGMIAFHLPRGAPKPPAHLADDLRLSQDLGLDSLSLTEMAFKMDELLGFTIETSEVVGITTVGELKAFLKRKLRFT